MNVNTIVAVAVVCGLASLSGCASMGKGKDSRSLASGQSENPIDFAYVARIDHQALTRGAIVLWVNPPYKNPAYKADAHN